MNWILIIAIGEAGLLTYWFLKSMFGKGNTPPAERNYVELKEGDKCSVHPAIELKTVKTKRIRAEERIYPRFVCGTARREPISPDRSVLICPECSFYTIMHIDEAGIEHVSFPDQIGNQVVTTCKKCSAPMVLKLERVGQFLSCSGSPECENSKPSIYKLGLS